MKRFPGKRTVLRPPTLSSPPPNIILGLSSSLSPSPLPTAPWSSSSAGKITTFPELLIPVGTATDVVAGVGVARVIDAEATKTAVTVVVDKVAEEAEAGRLVTVGLSIPMKVENSRTGEELLVIELAAARTGVGFVEVGVMRERLPCEGATVDA